MIEKSWMMIKNNLDLSYYSSLDQFNEDIKISIKESKIYIEQILHYQIYFYN